MKKEQEKIHPENSNLNTHMFSFNKKNNQANQKVQTRSTNFKDKKDNINH